MQYNEAIASILATVPVRALEAVEVSKQMGNWQLALSIAGKISRSFLFCYLQYDLSLWSLYCLLTARFSQPSCILSSNL